MNAGAAPRQPVTGWRRGWLAAAAVLLAAVSAVFVFQRIRPADETFRSGETAIRWSRSSVPTSTLPRDQFRLRWTPGPPDTRYQVSVTTEDLQVLTVAADLPAAEVVVPVETLAPVASGNRVLWQVDCEVAGRRAHIIGDVHDACSVNQLNNVSLSIAFSQGGVMQKQRATKTIVAGLPARRNAGGSRGGAGRTSRLSRAVPEYQPLHRDRESGRGVSRHPQMTRRAVRPRGSRCGCSMRRATRSAVTTSSCALANPTTMRIAGPGVVQGLRANRRLEPSGFDLAPASSTAASKSSTSLPVNIRPTCSFQSVGRSAWPMTVWVGRLSVTLVMVASAPGVAAAPADPFDGVPPAVSSETAGVRFGLLLLHGGAAAGSLGGREAGLRESHPRRPGQSVAVAGIRTRAARPRA